MPRAVWAACCSVVATAATIISLGGQAQASPTNNASGLETVASGVLRDSGATLGGGEVIVLAEPSPNAMDKAGKRGMRAIPLGAARTAADGSFKVVANLETLPKTHKGPHGEVQVDVLATDPTRSISWTYTLFPSSFSEPGTIRAISDKQGVPSSGTLPSGGIAPVTEFDLGAATAWNRGNDPATWLDNTGKPYGPERRLEAAKVAVSRPSGVVNYAKSYLTADSEKRSQMLAASDPTLCGQFSWGTEWKYNVQERFTDVYSASGIPVTLRQNESGSTSHTLGIAVVQSGGGLSASGTRTISTSATATQSNVIDASAYNGVNYRKALISCTAPQWTPYNFYDLFSQWTQAAEYNYSLCQTKYTGYVFETTTATNYTYASGVNFPGISLSAQSGYSSSVDKQYNWNRTGYLCYSNSAGPLSSAGLSAR